jgi:hypothetical protein
VPPTIRDAVRKSVAAVTVKSRTCSASKTWVRPSALMDTRSPVVARTSGRSVTILTRTDELVGVSNGSPWFGRSKAIRRLTQGNQRYKSAIPFARVNNQSESLRPLRRRAPKRTRMRVSPPGARMPPSGTTIVWSLIVAATATPSTVTGRSRISPRRAAIVFSSIRSMGPPEVLRMVAVESTQIARVAQVSLRFAR